MIKIIHYGSGNIQAIGNIYKRLNIPFALASTAADLESDTTKLILPGVGAFDRTMKQLMESGLSHKLNELVLQKKMPILGICVGMQILAKDSEEGELPGLGWIDGHVKKIDVSKLTHKPHLPHMGWNDVKPVVDHPILRNINYQEGFYFLHTYYFSCSDQKSVLCTTDYGNNFASGVYDDNIFGMQFHPEKSHNNGIQLLKNFAEL